MVAAEHRCALALAIALSLAACATSEDSHTHAPAVPTAAVEPGAPTTIHSPAVEALMTEKLNPALSRISFNLFHKDEPDHEQVVERAQAIAVMADELLVAAPPDEDLFRGFVAQLKNSATQLMESASERNKETEIHWFWHLRTSCRDCHDVYRFDVEEGK